MPFFRETVLRVYYLFLFIYPPAIYLLFHIYRLKEKKDAKDKRTNDLLAIYVTDYIQITVIERYKSIN